jgi:hypothetical protein
LESEESPELQDKAFTQPVLRYTTSTMDPTLVTTTSKIDPPAFTDEQIGEETLRKCDPSKATSQDESYKHSAETSEDSDLKEVEEYSQSLYTEDEVNNIYESDMQKSMKTESGSDFQPKENDTDGYQTTPKRPKPSEHGNSEVQQLQLSPPAASQTVHVLLDATGSHQSTIIESPSPNSPFSPINIQEIVQVAIHSALASPQFIHAGTVFT